MSAVGSVRGSSLVIGGCLVAGLALGCGSSGVADANRPNGGAGGTTGGATATGGSSGTSTGAAGSGGAAGTANGGAGMTSGGGAGMTSGGGAGGGASTDCSPDMTFADAALGRAVQRALQGVLSQPPRLGDITSLDINNSNLDVDHVASLEGLQCLTGLTFLRIHTEVLSDLSPIAGLPIETLEITPNEVDDNDVPIHGVIGDITPVATLTRLNKLNLAYNAITNIPPLADLERLRSVILPGNQISDLTPLAESGIDFLSVMDNPVAELGVLASLRSLVQLFAGPGISDLSGLGFVRSLISLGIYGCTDSDASWLSGRTTLQILQIKDCPIADLSGLADAKALTTLELENNAITDISSLSALTALNFLTIRGNPMSDIGPLASLGGLSNVYLDDNRIVDVSPLAELGLGILSLSGNLISDPSPLAANDYLSGVDLDDNLIADASLFEGSTMRGLSLAGNQLTDLTPFLELPLINLDVTRNPLTCADEAQTIADLVAKGCSVLSDCP
jgi:internalin A